MILIKSMDKVAILFALPRSNYLEVEGTDVYDLKRNALTFSGKNKVIAHPPCRFWCKIHYLAKPLRKEYELALWAYEVVKNNGGILEHPLTSNLWKYLDIKPFPLDQGWFGHKMRKQTGLYLKDVDLLPLPLKLEVKGEYKWNYNVSKREVMSTPIEFAKFLVESVRKSTLLESEPGGEANTGKYV